MQERESYLPSASTLSDKSTEVSAWTGQHGLSQEPFCSFELNRGAGLLFAGNMGGAVAGFLF